MINGCFRGIIPHFFIRLERLVLFYRLRRNIFFRAKGQQSDLVERWNDSTKRHLKSNYVTCMTDANLLSTEGKKRLITKPIIDNSLIWYLKDSGDQAILAAITGVV